MTSRPLTKFDWVEALVSAPSFKSKCGAVRTGTMIAIAYFNEQQGMAWPSRAELAKRLNSAPERVSEWVSDLRKERAIITRQQGRLAKELRKSSDPRSLVYILNMDWAARILARKVTEDGLRGRLVPGRRKVTNSVTESMTNSVTESMTNSVTESMTNSVTDLGDEPRHTNTEGIQIEMEKSGADITELGVYARSLEELPYDPPSTPEDGEAWLIRQGVDDRKIGGALQRLMRFRLYPSDLTKLRRGVA